MSGLQPTPLQEPVANLGFLNRGSAEGTRIEMPQVLRGYGRESGCALPDFFLKSLFLK